MDVLSSLVIDRGTAEPDTSGVRFLAYARSGDVAILDEVLAQHLDRAYGFALRLLPAAEAEDVVQEAFIKIIRVRDRYDGSSPFVAWMTRIVHDTAISYLRSRGRRRRREARVAAENPLAIAPTGRDADANQDVAIRAAVAELPDKYRATVSLHYFAGLSQADTAKALGLNENAVAKRLERARDYLRSILLSRGVAVGSAGIAIALASAPVEAAPASLFARMAPALKTNHIASPIGHGMAVKIAAVAMFAAGGVGVGISQLSDRTSLLVRYDFNSEAVAAPIVGTHRFAIDRGPDGSRCLVCDDKIFVPLGSKDQLPLRIDCKLRLTGEGSGIMAAGWSKVTEEADFYSTGKTVMVDSGWINGTFFVTDRTVDVWYNDQRASLYYCVPAHDAQVGLLIHDLPCLIDDLVARTVTKREIPDVSLFLRALDSIPPEQRHGTVSVASASPDDPPLSIAFQEP